MVLHSLRRSETVMKIGDVAKCIYTGEIVIVTSPVNSAGYVDVHSATGKDWHMPKEHLEVINESR